jgi:hypothetical protein
MGKIYSKLAKARKMLQESGLKKTGKGHNFIYFELADFLPTVNKIFDELQIASFTKITLENCELTLVDGEDDSTITFEIPYATFKSDEKRNLQAVQERGAEITYLTRYLWVQALNIVEPDTVDRSRGAQQTTQPVQQAQTATVKTNNYINDLTYWDGVSPIKEFDCFVVDQPDGSQITYKTMKSKKDGHLFGLAVIPEANSLPQALKYYELG